MLTIEHRDNRVTVFVALALVGLVAFHGTLAYASVCKGEVLTVQGSASGTLLNRTSFTNIKRVAVKRLARHWRAKAMAKYGARYVGYKPGRCICRSIPRRPRRGDKVRIACKGWARACTDKRTIPCKNMW